MLVIWIKPKIPMDKIILAVPLMLVHLIKLQLVF
jgi:hypothetical protein